MDKDKVEKFLGLINRIDTDSFKTIADSLLINDVYPFIKKLINEAQKVFPNVPAWWLINSFLTGCAIAVKLNFNNTLPEIAIDKSEIKLSFVDILGEELKIEMDNVIQNITQKIKTKNDMVIVLADIILACIKIIEEIYGDTKDIH